MLLPPLCVICGSRYSVTFHKTFDSTRCYGAAAPSAALLLNSFQDGLHINAVLFLQVKINIDRKIVEKKPHGEK
jgi:hypothetical protein